MDIFDKERSPFELFSALSAVQDELTKKGLMEDRNGLTGNLAEVYFCASYKVVRMNERGFDTVVEGRRVQIKGGLRTTSQTGTLLGYKGKASPDAPFDDLAIVMFESNYEIADAVLLPISAVHDIVRVNQRNNAAFVSFGASLWKLGENISDRLRRAAADINEIGHVPLEYRKPKKASVIGKSNINYNLKKEYTLIKKKNF